MKVFTLLFLTILIFSISDLRSQGLNDVSSNNGLNVWAVGDNGLVIRSVEGGNYWDRVTVGNNNYNSIVVRGPFIWIAGDNGDIERSSTSGNSFVSIPSGTAANLKSIYFADNFIGWISGDSGIILKTTNGGVNWSIQNTATKNNLNQVKFFTYDRGVACGNNGTILISSDAGVNWFKSNTPTDNELLSIDVKYNTIICSGVQATVLKSTNFGTDWNLLDYKIETKSDVNCVYMISEPRNFTVGGGGFIRLSNDAGNTFSFVSNPMLADLKKINFSNSKGWAVSNSTNAVLRTTDQGLTWLLPAGFSQSFSWEMKIPLSFYTSSGNVFATNPANNNEIFVTKGNAIYRSVNKGNNWSMLTSIPQFSINSTSNAFLISPYDTNVFLVAIDSNLTDVGKVMRSTDYGQSWSIVFSGIRNADGCPLEMDPNHPDTVYYAPSDSFLYKSTNFGLNWTQVGNKHFTDICIVEVLEDSSNIILVGDADYHGTLYRSSDYGINWTNVNDTLAYEIPDIANSKLNPSTVYSAFFEGIGGLKRSTNRGVNWVNLNVDYLAWAVDIARDDPNTLAYGTWSNNPIYISTNGGVHFFQTAIIPDGTFALYYYDRATLFAQMSNGFYKMKINYSVPIGINQINSIVPEKFELFQNYPNPFNPTTNLEFGITELGNVSLKIYDGLGREVQTLVNGNLAPGNYKVDFDGSNFASGIYYYKLESGNFIETKRMMLLK